MNALHPTRRPLALPALSLPALWLAALLPLSAGAADGALEKVTVRATAHFDFDRAAVRPDDRQQLLAEVAQIKDVTWQTVTAIGHTDSIGSDAYNRGLARKRAQSVRDYLVAQGLDPAMIRVEARAEDEPLADNDSAEGRARNRRTEVAFEGVRTTPR